MGFLFHDDGCNDNEMIIARNAFETCARMLEAKIVEARCCQGEQQNKFCESLSCQTLLDLAAEFRRMGG